MVPTTTSRMIVRNRSDRVRESIRTILRRPEGQPPGSRHVERGRVAGGRRHPEPYPIRQAKGSHGTEPIAFVRGTCLKRGEAAGKAGSTGPTAGEAYRLRTL